MGRVKKVLKKKLREELETQMKSRPKALRGYAPAPVSGEQLKRMLTVAKATKTIQIIKCPCIACGSIVYVHTEEGIDFRGIVACRQECADWFKRVSGVGADSETLTVTTKATTSADKGDYKGADTGAGSVVDKVVDTSALTLLPTVDKKTPAK